MLRTRDGAGLALAPRAPRATTAPVPDPLGTIARHLAPCPPDDRTFRRRRLASLAGVLVLVLAVAPFVDGRDDVVGVTTDAAATDGTVVRAAGLRTPSGVRELLSETTTTLVEATGATTSTTSSTVVATVPPSTSTSAVARADDPGAGEPTTTTTEASSARALHTEPSRTEEPTTTEPPAPTTTTTAAPSTTTTTAPAPAEHDTSEGGYAYDDPRSTQVWYDLAECESGGDWSIDTGNGYYGGLQFSLRTWESVGGSGYPHEHPAATQIELGRRLQARQGWGAWPHCSEELGLR